MRFHEVSLVLFSSALMLHRQSVRQSVRPSVRDEPRYRAAIAAKNLTNKKREWDVSGEFLITGLVNQGQE